MAEEGKGSIPIEKDKGGTPFNKMSRGRKFRFICKVVVCVLTFGFMFPDVMND